MTKTLEQTVDWLIDTVKQALEDGRATEAELEEWLMATITLEELALEEAAQEREARTFSSWMAPTGTLH